MCFRHNRVAALVGHCLLDIALVYLQALCSPVSTLIGRQALHSSSGCKLYIPRVNTSTIHSQLFLLLSGIHFPWRFDCYQRVTRSCSTNCSKLTLAAVV